MIAASTWKSPPTTGDEPVPPARYNLPDAGAGPDDADTDYQALLAARAFDIDRIPSKPTPLLTLGGKVITTPGNLTVCQSAAKSGKTAVVGACLAAVLTPDGAEVDTLGFSACNPDGNAVLHFDTEQSPYDHDQLVRRSIKRAGRSDVPDFVRSYCLTDLDYADRLECVSAAVSEAAMDCGGVALVLVDGVADLCLDPNDARASFDLVRRLHSEAILYNCGFFLVLHENAGSVSGKMRGHLGSQLERKAETVLRLQKNPTTGVTTMWAETARHCHIAKSDGSCFVWDDDQGRHATCVPVLAAGKAEGRRAKFLAEATQAFGGQHSLRYTDLVAAIGSSTGLKVAAAKQRVSAYLAECIIARAQDGGLHLI